MLDDSGWLLMIEKELLNHKRYNIKKCTEKIDFPFSHRDLKWRKTYSSDGKEEFNNPLKLVKTWDLPEGGSDVALALIFHQGGERLGGETSGPLFRNVWCRSVAWEQGRSDSSHG